MPRDGGIDPSLRLAGISGASGPAVPSRDRPRRPARRIWPVGELLSDVRQGLELAYPLLWVQGEISDLKQHRSGHWYFSLKDDDGVLPAAMFRSANRAVPFEPENGLEIIVCGRLTLYEPRGKFQLIAELIEPVGAGSLQLAFEQLKARLEADGLFAPERKRDLPKLPRRIGVVTSPSGAAWRDMVRTWRRRRVGLSVVLSPAAVQGEHAGAQIVTALELLESTAGVELIVLARGGGSREELWAFNEEVVARAIAACGVPVISAVGHETDITIADLVADRRAATPTAAAEIVAPSGIELANRLEALGRRVRASGRRRIDAARVRLRAPSVIATVQPSDRRWARLRTRTEAAAARVDAAVARLVGDRQRRLTDVAAIARQHAPAALARRYARRLEADVVRVERAVRANQHRARESLAGLAARVNALSPLAVLGRGYSICRSRSTGRILRDSATVSAGERVDVRLYRGTLPCRVIDHEPVAEATTSLPGSNT